MAKMTNDKKLANTIKGRMAALGFSTLSLCHVLDSIFQFVVKKMGVDLGSGNLAMAKGFGYEDKVSGSAIQAGGKSMAQGVDGEFFSNACSINPLTKPALHLPSGNAGASVGQKKRFTCRYHIPSLSQPVFQKPAQMAIDKPAFTPSSLGFDSDFFIIQPDITNIEIDKFREPDAGSQKEFKNNPVPFSHLPSLPGDNFNQKFSFISTQKSGLLPDSSLDGKAPGRVFRKNIMVDQKVAKGAQTRFQPGDGNLRAHPAGGSFLSQIREDEVVDNVRGKTGNINIPGKSGKPAKLPPVDINGKFAFIGCCLGGQKLFDRFRNLHFYLSPLNTIASLLIFSLGLYLSSATFYPHVCLASNGSQVNSAAISTTLSGTKKGAGRCPTPVIEANIYSASLKNGQDQSFQSVFNKSFFIIGKGDRVYQTLFICPDQKLSGDTSDLQFGSIAPWSAINLGSQFAIEKTSHMGSQHFTKFFLLTKVFDHQIEVQIDGVLGAFLFPLGFQIGHVFGNSVFESFYFNHNLPPISSRHYCQLPMACLLPFEKKSSNMQING